LHRDSERNDTWMGSFAFLLTQRILGGGKIAQKQGKK